MCSELTKLYEEIIRLTLEEAIEYYKDKAPRGEYVLVVEGKSKEAIEQDEKAKWDTLTIEEHIQKYMEGGIDKKDAMKKVAKDRGMAKSEIYKHSLKL